MDQQSKGDLIAEVLNCVCPTLSHMCYMSRLSKSSLYIPWHAAGLCTHHRYCTYNMAGACWSFPLF